MEAIRTATENDLSSLAPLALALWPENTSMEIENDLAAILRSAQSRLLLACNASTILGFLHIEIRHDYVEGSDSSPTGYIEGIYVKPEYRKTRVAYRLLVAGEQWLREQGCNQVGSDTELDNQASYDFHVRTGFKEASRLIAFIKDLN